MDREDIQRAVSNEAEKFYEFARRQNRQIRLTPGALAALGQMVENIEADPSSHWMRVDSDDIQRQVIFLLPNILIDMFARWPRRADREWLISSWEIWHNLSPVLDKWCPVPKDI
jgi:hypothetical protein